MDQMSKKRIVGAPVTRADFMDSKFLQSFS